MTAGKINDAEPPHSQSDVIAHKQAFIVRTAMHDRLAHLVDERFLDPFGPVRANDSCNSAHSAYVRSEEHTSELQSPCNLVCRLLLEKKKKTIRHYTQHNPHLALIHDSALKLPPVH